MSKDTTKLIPRFSSQRRVLLAFLLVFGISAQHSGAAMLRMSPSCASAQDVLTLEGSYEGYNLDETKVSVSANLIDLVYRQTSDGTPNPPTHYFSRTIGPLTAGNYVARLFRQYRESTASAYGPLELAANPLPIKVQQLPVSRFGLSSLSVLPDAPTDADSVEVDFRLVQFLAPSYLESFTYTINASRIDLYVDLMQGDYSAQSEICAPVAVGELAAGDYHVYLWSRRRASETSAFSEFALYASTSLRVSPKVKTVPVVEFRHAGLNHYFLSTNAEEIALLDSNAQLGWTRTGAEFNGYSIGASPVRASLVCRFYGSTTPGPNSHFYTLFAEECGALQALAQATPSTFPRWNYEGSAFAAIRPIDSESCPLSNPVAVRRFYNGRAVLNDSNHRYVVDPAIAATMRNSGWRDEGVSMCAAP